MNLNLKKHRRPKRSKKAGLPAGSLNQISPPLSDRSKVIFYFFDKDSLEKVEDLPTNEIIQKIELYKNSGKTLWINVDGHGEPLILQKICEIFEIHPLVLEDIITTGQRPKTENYEHFSYTVLQSITACNIGFEHSLEMEQISLVLGSNFLISFQEKEGDTFKSISSRLQHNSSKIRTFGPDFLAYTIIDFIVDQYFSILETFGDQLDLTEEITVKNPSPQILSQLYQLKRTALELRRAVWPLRELTANIDRLEGKFISDATRLYLRDVYSHIAEIIDSIEIYREMISSLIDLYMSSINNRLNEVMKVLTVITTIFMPLSFLAGVYGMNFENMPELKWVYGYPIVLFTMLVMAVGMFLYFRNKRWI